MDKFADFRFKTAEAQKIMQDINKNPIMMACQVKNTGILIFQSMSTRNITENIHGI